MSTEDTEMPVSLEWFKKYTYHEEMVKKILKAKAHGNAEKLKEYLNSEKIKQKVLENYYRSFYLNPETRQKHPIRYKPMPKRQKDILLQYPKSKGSTDRIVNVGGNDQSDLSCNVKKIKGATLMKQSGNDEVMAEDDEQLSEDEVPSTSTKQKPHKRILSPVAGECLKSQLTETNTKEQPPPKRLKADTRNNTEIATKPCDIPAATTKIHNNAIMPETENSKPECQISKIPFEFASCNVKDFKINSKNNVKSLSPESEKKYKKYSKKKVLQKENDVTPINTVETSMENAKKQLKHRGKRRHVNIASSLHVNDMIKFAYKCPVTFREFKSYTNIMDLVNRRCTQKYSNPKDRVPYWAKKVYLIYYLYPELRQTDGLMKQIIALPNCPDSLKPKLLEIPVIEDNNDGQPFVHKTDGDDNNNGDNSVQNQNIDISPVNTITDVISNPMHMRLKDSDCGVGVDTNCPEAKSKEINTFPRRISNGNNCETDMRDPALLHPTTVQKEYVEILEHQILPNMPKNPNCKFCQVSLELLSANSNFTNVLQNMGVEDAAAKREMYIGFMELDEDIVSKLVVEGSLVLKLLKCPTVCTDCERKWRRSKPQANVLQETTSSDSVTMHEIPSRPQANVMEGIRTPEPAIVEERSHLTSMDSAIPEQVVTSSGIDYVKETCECLGMVNDNNELFSKFCNVLLEALREPFEYNQFPVTLDEFKQCSMYEEPLKQIICDFCGPKVKLVQGLVNNKDLYHSLLSYYYRNFFTNPNLRKKYPLKLKGGPASLHSKMLNFMKATEVKGAQVEQKASPAKRQPTDDASISHEQQSVKNDNVHENIQEPNQQLLKTPQDGEQLSATEDKGTQVVQKDSLAKLQPIDGASIIHEQHSAKKDNMLENIQEPNQQLLKTPQDGEELSATEDKGTQVAHKDSPAKRQPTDDANIIHEEHSVKKENMLENIQEPIQQLLKTPQDGGESSATTTKKNIKKSDLICLEKIKEVFNFPVHRTLTLSYVLRTSFGLKQRITQVLSDLSLQEFKSFTNIFERKKSFRTEKSLKYLYDCVCQSSVWPENLYIKLEDILLKLVHSGLIVGTTTELSEMLTHISPKFLHWSNLLETTNFIACVQSDYLYRTGEIMDVTNTNIKQVECKNYYSRCWRHEQWIGQTPKINENVLTNLRVSETAANITSTSEVSLHKVCLRPIIDKVAKQFHMGESNIHISLDDKTQENCPDQERVEETVCRDIVEEITESSKDNTSMRDVLSDHEVPTQTPEDWFRAQESNSNHDSTELLEENDGCTEGDNLLNTNYMPIPNTQDQIGALPPETIVPDIIDPLEAMDSKHIMGNSNDYNDIIIVDDEDVTIKTEIERYLPLRDLKFSEDSDGNIECNPMREPVVDLDTSPEFNENDETMNLPSSQMDFGDDEINVNQLDFPIETAQKCSGDLISSGSSGSTFNLGQRLPSYCYSSESQQDTIDSMNTVLQPSDVISSNNDGKVEEECFIVQKNGDNNPESANINRVDNNVEAIGVFREVRSYMGTVADTLPTTSKLPCCPIKVIISSQVRKPDGTVNAKTKTKKKETKTTKGDIVPQRTHTIRPLPLDIRTSSLPSSTSNVQPTAITASATNLEPTVTSAKTKTKPPVSQPIQSNTNENKEQSVSSGCSQDTDNCIEISRNFQPAVTSSQTGPTSQSQVTPHSCPSQRLAILPPEYLRVSQELLKDCTVFNNTSLLRAADQFLSSSTPTTTSITDRK